MSEAEALAFHPATADRWPDVERLFGERGACGGCWCMEWRKPRREFDADKGDGNRASLKALVEGGDPPGLLAYAGGEPVGWVAVAPRAAYRRLETSRILKPVDDQPVWSISCFFIRRDHRGKGIATALLEAAAEWAGSRGAEMVEGYPVEPKKRPMPATFAWTGFDTLFLRTGFREVARRSETRPIMRRALT